ncbi:MAG: FlgD immunoglobulin-like domain containing protein [Candidatus Cloacimonetes bacterium]|nr:FlgD immunoglobulin-like domain containing protein [Candidatus Cloacimonadota bacterium]
MRSVVFVLILIPGLIFAGLSDVIVPEFNFTNFNSESGYQIVNGVVYVTYVKEQDESKLCFAKMNLGGELIYSNENVDSKNNFDICYPSIAVNENNPNIIYIVYNDYANGLLSIAASSDGGQSFENYVVDSEVYDIPKIVIKNNELYFNYLRDLEALTHRFSYFTETDTNENADTGTTEGEVYFFGQDVLSGRVHSNTSIYIKLVGGGQNNGYPTFRDFATTGEEFIWRAGSPNYELAFPGGYEENYPLSVSSTEDLHLLENANQPFGSESIYEIIYVKIDGNAYESMLGDIIETGIEAFPVYGPGYPTNYNPNEILGYNEIMMKDTLWVEGPSGSLADGSSVFVPSTLWIEGTISGNQVWLSDDNVYLTGDILYTNTVPGENPHGDIEAGVSVNMTDYFTLISGERIYIKYKHRDPFENNEVKSPNCEDIYLYGSFAAKGDGEGNPHLDGIISLEYQHPHPSTPHMWHNDSLYTYVDLHRYKLPQILEDDPLSWPGDIDWPWYNPVYPETDPIGYRGVIRLYGSVYQIRRGYVRRSGSDPANHSSGGVWDMSAHKFGSTHVATGYDKDYKYDKRLAFQRRHDLFGSIFARQMVLSNLNLQTGTLNENVIHESANRLNYFYDIAIKENKIVVAVLGEISNSGQYDENDRFSILYSDNFGESFTTYEYIIPEYEPTEKISVTLGEDIICAFNGRVYRIDSALQLHEVAEFDNSDVSLQTNRGGETAIAVKTASSVSLKKIENNDVIDIFNMPYSEDDKFSFSFTNEDSLAFWFTNGDLMPLPWTEINGFSYGSIAEFVNIGDDVVTPEQISLVAYPNPFSSSNTERGSGTTISFSIPEDAHVNISVFNIKGQRVKTLINSEYEKGKHPVVWNGDDESGRKVSTGLYLYKLNIDGKDKLIKKMLMLK